MAHTQSPVIELKKLSKRFGSVQANDSIDIQVHRGTIHAIVGENGAGKSTAMKMLYGIYPPDSGEIWVDGKQRNWRSPLDAISSGIGMVHQHFMLAEPYSALDNVLVGAEPVEERWKWLPKFIQPIDRESAREKLEALAKRYSMQVNWDENIEDLPVGEQQRIEILKTLYRDAEFLILDEPTAVLTPQEVGELFENLRKLKEEGKTILIITHKLKEVLALSDRVTCFRRGKISGERPTEECDEETLAELMVGRKVALRIEPPSAPSVGKPVLEWRNLAIATDRKGCDDFNFAVNGGEIVGIAGVEGNGQTEILQAILNPKVNVQGGEYRLFDESANEFRPRDVKESGVGFIPEDRISEGLLLSRSMMDNFLLGRQFGPTYQKYGFLRKDRLREKTVRAIREFDVRPPIPEVAAGGLSGGNQQKLIIAREFDRLPRFLVAAQPTRGVDVGAIEFIHKQIIEARDRGAGVLLVSSELDEVMALSDRILVVYEGRVVGEFRRGAKTEYELGVFMCGGGES